MWTVILVREESRQNIPVECRDSIEAWVIACKLADACGTILEMCESNRVIMVPATSELSPLPPNSVHVQALCEIPAMQSN